MAHSIRSAVFPVAGLGTRFLPATKATPKELLPVIDTPLIQYAIDEARAAGIERLVFVSHPSKRAIERHVMDDARLRNELSCRGKEDLARELAETALCRIEDDVVFTMQPACRSGILSATGQSGRVVSADGMVEKPAPEAAPSCEAVVGRYILHPSVFEDLARQGPGAGGEIQLTDAITAGASRLGLAGFRFSGERFDCGSKQGMLQAILHIASQDPDYAEVMEAFRAAGPLQSAA
jgi:UTP--glucose-1-phosphate uridylyltransferase